MKKKMEKCELDCVNQMEDFPIMLKKYILYDNAELNSTS